MTNAEFLDLIGFALAALALFFYVLAGLLVMMSCNLEMRQAAPWMWKGWRFVVAWVFWPLAFAWVFLMWRLQRKHAGSI
jgi:hypothetical protein